MSTSGRWHFSELTCSLSFFLCQGSYYCNEYSTNIWNHTQSMLKITAVWTFHSLKFVHFANNQHCRGEKWVQRQGDFKDCIGRQKSPKAKIILRITLSAGKFGKVLNKHTLQDFLNDCTIPRLTRYVQKSKPHQHWNKKTNLGPSAFPDCGFDFRSAGSLFYKTLIVVADTSF
jgi:hypothetical protein